MKFEKKPSTAVDAIGAALVVGALLLAGWLGVVDSADARTLLGERREDIATSRVTLVAIKAQADAHRRTLEDHERVVAELGGDASATTVEAYLQVVSTLAQRHDVRVLQHRPIGERTYPGLRERLFAFQVGGTTENIWHLLRSIEEIEAWADVSYMKLHGGALVTERIASLTISMFFEVEDLPAESDGDDGD